MTPLQAAAAPAKPITPKKGWNILPPLSRKESLKNRILQNGGNLLGMVLNNGGNRPMTVPMERVENRILSIRGHRVVLAGYG